MTIGPGPGRGNSLGHQGQESLNKVGCSTPEPLISMPPHFQLVPFYPMVLVNIKVVKVIKSSTQRPACLSVVYLLGEL